LKRLVEETKKLAQPIDFAELERRGVISKAGNWYRVHNFHGLPEHATKKIYELVEDRNGIKVKFANPSRAAKMLKRLEGAATKEDQFER
jgi:hypothetical protein